VHDRALQVHDRAFFNAQEGGQQNKTQHTVHASQAHDRVLYTGFEKSQFFWDFASKDLFRLCFDPKITKFDPNHHAKFTLSFIH